MCAIIGAVIKPGQSLTAGGLINYIYAASHARGRDGRGYASQWDGDIVDGDDGFYVHKDTKRLPKDCDGMLPQWPAFEFSKSFAPDLNVFLANLRAEPTTEYVARKTKDDQQPYTCGKWTIVHNGTVANDKALRTYDLKTMVDSAAIAEVLNSEQLLIPGRFDPGQVFRSAIKHIKGSYAILAHHKQTRVLYFACNYRPIWYARVPNVGVFLASSRDYFPDDCNPEMVPPYSHGRVTEFGVEIHSLPRESNKRAIAICSGGLDSVVAATFAKKILSMDVTLLHFLYGSRAEGPEVEAVKQVAKELDADLIFQHVAVYRPEDSPLLRADSKIAGGEAGAEFAHEWVPARNLVMLSLATAIAEARGAETLILGNNLEEAGAYPDNEPEFIDRFNDLLPFAVGDGKHVRVIMPVGNMMKHEIVALGVQLGAPLQHTWSCYRAGQLHCGTCGPCFMRKTAFKINNLTEVIEYQK